MSRESNPVSEAVSNKTQFVSEVNNATKKFFENDNFEILHSSKNREIKAYRDDKNMVIYVLDKQKDKIIVTVDDIYDFNQEKDIKGILHWQYKDTQGQIKDDLYMHTVIECSLKEAKKPKQKEKLPKTEEEFEDSLRNKMNESKVGEETEGLIQHFMNTIKNAFGEKFISNQRFIDIYFNAQNPVTCTSDVGTLQQYTQLLHDKGYLAEVQPEEFFINLNERAIPQYQKMLADWTIGMNGMIKACKENNYRDYEKAFEFNDLDNHVWVKDDKLVVTSQNVGFYFHIKDENNFNVYLLEKEYKDVEEEMERIDNALKNEAINNVKDIVLKVENGQITQLNYSLMHCFELDMEYSVKAMKQEGILTIQYPVDITSYEYQKDYYAHRFGITEFEFVAQAMMTIGGGFDYSKEEGNFIDDSVKYIPNLPKAPDTRNETFTNFNYLYPKKISHLNADWLDGLKYAVEVLKRDKPTPVAFEGDNVEDALEKAIKYYDIKISKLEKSKNKPNI